MSDPVAPNTLEAQLELLLRELLDEGTSTGIGILKSRDLPPEMIELVDIARRLRVASQGTPLPDECKAWGAPATTSSWPERRSWSRREAGRSRTWRWFWAGAAAAVILGVFGLTGGVESPSGPWYSARLALEDLQVALIPNPLGKAQMLIKSTHTRITEIEAMAASGDTRGLRLAASALDNEAGWLHAVVATLPAADQEWVRRELDHM